MLEKEVEGLVQVLGADRELEFTDAMGDVQHQPGDTAKISCQIEITAAERVDGPLAK